MNSFVEYAAEMADEAFQNGSRKQSGSVSVPEWFKESVKNSNIPEWFRETVKNS